MPQSGPDAGAFVPSQGRRPTSGWRRRTFASLIESSNYRRFVLGQAISLVGTWMQMIGQSWLVLQLTGSATALGLVAAVQTLPILLLSPYAGVLVDRRSKRRVLLATQTVMALLALALGLLTLTHTVRLWMVMVIAGVVVGWWIPPVLACSTRASQTPRKPPGAHGHPPTLEPATLERPPAGRPWRASDQHHSG